MRCKRLAAVVTAAAAIVSMQLLVGPAATAEASSTCTSYTSYKTYYTGTSVLHMPSVGSQSGNLNCTLRVGNRSMAVLTLQETLRECYDHNVKIDGIYGPQTRGAVLQIQRLANSGYEAGLAEDGIYGPHTRNWMQFLLYPPTGGCWPPPF
jgi:peptidoglycan hydrolase-like protein with peptidoglycan-binding domain